MNKKFLMGLGATLAVVASIAAMSAYEAHVINVTAHIENALTVDTYEIDFGTVFPQEYTERNFTVRLSDSFIAADRVDDVDYIIKQKPKCWNWGPGQPEPAVIEYAPVDYATHLCPEGFYMMLDLCPFLSKLPLDMEKGDYGVPSYYIEDSVDYCTPVPAEPQHASGRLTKIGNDTSDNWAVDLKVPPVDGFIGQDWPESCADWVVPENEKDYGCDLWVEITGISLTNGSPVCGNGIKEAGEECDDGNNEDGDGCSANCTIEGICVAKPDVMQVLDRSGSIDAGELTTLKAAANAFVTAMSPSTDGVHMGMVSFSTLATLDVHLTDNGAVVIAAINLLSSGGLTNLEDAIQEADYELANTIPPGDGDDRVDADSPDYMVIITDGEPTTSNAGGDHAANAKAAADAAKANDITIYVVGVGTTGGTADYLKNQIASSPSHYFDAANWADLEAILLALSCPPAP